MLAKIRDGNILGLAIASYRQGDMVNAGVLFRLVLEHDPSNAIANHQLGLLAFAEGDSVSAATFLQRATISDPQDPEYQNNLGVVLTALGDHAGARKAFEKAIAQNGDFAQAFNNLGAALEAAGEDMASIGAYRRALEIDPGYVEARDNLDLACARVAPAWHFTMMADVIRNRAYDQALLRAAPGRRVLDIGSGSGLLAMMAARAGAASVTTCETVPAIAAAARKIIGFNGFADYVTLHTKRSDQLQIGRDMEVRANLLVTETFSSSVLSESVLPTIEHAREHLLTPDAVVIPRRAAARGYLVGGAAVEAQFFASPSVGFDLWNFDVFAPSKIGLHMDRVPHIVLSDDFEIFAFDLMQSRFPPQRRSLVVSARRAGRCIGVVQWLRLDLDADTTYENRPAADAGANGWMHVLYRLQEPVELSVGDEVHLLASHTRTAMTVALAR
jgi:predicted nicotinamide N-methyase